MNQDRAEILARFRKEMAVMALIVLISMVLSVVWSFGFTFVLEPRIAEFAFTETFSDLAGLAMIGLSADFAWMVWKLDQAVEDFGKNETVPLPQSLAELHRNLLEILDQGQFPPAGRTGGAGGIGAGGSRICPFGIQRRHAGGEPDPAGHTAADAAALFR